MRRISILPVFLVPVVLVLYTLFPISANLHAQQVRGILQYQGSIINDEEEKRLRMPSLVIADPVMNEIYIIDGRSRIIIYTSDFFPLLTLDRKNGIVSPTGLAVDHKGNLYVTQTASELYPRDRITVLNACLKWERDIYLKGFEGAFFPYKILVDKTGNIYAIDPYQYGILIFDNNGHLLQSIYPEENGKKVHLTNLSLDEKGRLYLLSEQVSHVYVYDESRKFLFKFGEKGGSTGKLSRPKSVAVDNLNERFYVLDYNRHSIIIYNSEGNFISEFGGMGWAEGWFEYPIDLSIDSSGRVMVADFFNDRVQFFIPR